MLYKIKMCVWELTLRCNIHCLHCGSSANNQTRKNELTTQEALDVVEQLAELGCENVVLSGGEPFLRKDWATLALRMVDLGIRVSFISNGYLFNDDILDILKVIRPVGTGFSLDGGCRETHDYIRGRKGVFDRCIKALNKCSKAGFYSSAITTVHKMNFPELDRILEILVENGVRAWQLQTATPQGRMPRELALDENEFYSLAKFIAQKKKEYKNIIDVCESDCIGYFGTLGNELNVNWRGCPAGMRVLGIESDGTIKGCLSIHHGEKYEEGNVRERSLIDIWNDKNSFSYNRRFNPENLKGICKECKYGSICRGGCSEQAKSFTDSEFGSPFCIYNYEKTHGIIK